MISRPIFSILVLTAVMLSGMTLVYADSFGSSSFDGGSSFGSSDFGGSSFDGGSSFGGSSFGGSSFDGGSSFGSSDFGGSSFSQSSSPPPSWDNGKSWFKDGKEQTYNINGITKEGFTKEQVYEKAQFNNKYGVTYYKINYGYPVYHSYWGYGGYHYANSDWWFHLYMWTLIFNQQEASQQKHFEQLAINNATDVVYDVKQHKYVSGK